MKKSLFKSIKVLCLALIMLVNSIVPFTMAFAEDEIVYKFDASDPSTVPAPLFTNSYGNTANHSTNPYKDRLDQDRLDQIPHLKLVGDELVYDANGTETTSKKENSTSNVDTYQTYIFGGERTQVGEFDGKNVFSADIYFENIPYGMYIGLMRGPSQYYNYSHRAIMVDLTGEPKVSLREDIKPSLSGWAKALSPREWHNVTIEYDISSAWSFSASLYVDGILLGSIENMSHSYTSTTDGNKNYNGHAPVLILNTAYGSGNNFIKADLKMKNICLKNGDTAEAPAQTMVETDSGYAVKWVDAVDTTFQWQVSANEAGGYADIADATNYNFDIPQGYEGKYIRCAVTTAGATSYTEAEYIPTDDGEIVYEFDASNAATVPTPLYVDGTHYRNDWQNTGKPEDSANGNPYKYVDGEPIFVAVQGDGNGEFKYVSNGEYNSYLNNGSKMHSYQQYIFGGDGLVTAPATGSKKYTFELDVKFEDSVPTFYVGLQRSDGVNVSKRYKSNAGKLTTDAIECNMRQGDIWATNRFSKNPLGMNKWYHITMVYDISGTKVIAKAYIDGTPIGMTEHSYSGSYNKFSPYFFIYPDSEGTVFNKSTITAKNIVLRKGEMIPDESIGKSSNDIHVKNLSDMCSTFKWQQSDSRDEGYTDINNETNYNLANLESLNGKWVRCVITPSAESGEPQSGIITNAILVGGGSVANYNYRPVVGSNTLSASVSVHNQAENKVDFEILAAVYENGALAGLQVVSDLSLEADEDISKDINMTFNLESIENIKVKFFALTKDNIKPLMKAIEK